MRRITTQDCFGQNKQLPFCYLCGKALDDGRPTNDDHCPPKRVFHASDRSDYPIILKVHEECNHAWHLSDDLLSLFFDPVSQQGKVLKEKHRNRMDKNKVSCNFRGQDIEGYTNIPLRPFALRLIQCMHAILYKEWLPTNTNCDFLFPFPEIDSKGKLVSEEIYDVSLAMSKRIASSIQANTYDCITAYNNKFKYACCWSTFDSGNPVCVFAFDIMEMAKMAKPIGELPKAVIGSYAMKFPESDHSNATRLELSIKVNDLLYPLVV
jgi:hypothetical protein